MGLPLDSTAALYFTAALFFVISAVFMVAPASILTEMYPTYKPDDRGFNVSAFFCYLMGWWAGDVANILFLVSLDCSKLAIALAVCMHGVMLVLYVLATNETPYPTMAFEKLPFVTYAAFFAVLPIIAVASYGVYVEDSDRMQLVYLAGSIATTESVPLLTANYHHKQLAKKLAKLNVAANGAAFVGALKSRRRRGTISVVPLPEGATMLDEKAADIQAIDLSVLPLPEDATMLGKQATDILGAQAIDHTND
jgi:hypothetical protein